MPRKGEKVPYGSKPPRKAPIKYRESFVIDAYELASEGAFDRGIAEAIGIDPGLLSLWLSKHDLLAEAVGRGRKKYKERKNAPLGGMVDYVYDRLPENLKEVWDKIEIAYNAPLGAAKIESILRDKGDKVRQHLWMHAMISTNFNQSKAGALVNVSESTVKRWLREDPDFPTLWDEVKEHLKNFFQSHLIERVAEGDVQATIFANRTFNKDRGFGESKDINVNGAITHSHLHGVITIDPEELGLPPEVNELILKALEARGYRKTPDLVEVANPSYYQSNISDQTEIMVPIDES